VKISLRLILIILITTGCTNLCTKDRKNMSADDVVREYLEIAFNMQEVSQKRLLLQYTTGELKAAIASANDETIKEAYIKPRYNLLSMSITERRDMTPRESHISYLLTYKETSEQGEKKESATIKTENTVALTKEKGMWFINGVLDNKTHIEFPLLKTSIIKGIIK
jgi:hypothetical protein